MRKRPFPLERFVRQNEHRCSYEKEVPERFMSSSTSFRTIVATV